LTVIFVYSGSSLDTA